MEDLIEKLNKLGGPSIRLNNDLKKYKDGKHFEKKFAMMNKMLEESGLPDAYYEQQARLLYENQNTEELSVAHEPMPEYNEIGRASCRERV